MLTSIENERWHARIQRGGYLAKVFQRCFSSSWRVASRRKGSRPTRAATIETVSLSGKELRVLDISQYVSISCLEGAVWITFPRRFCDYILKEGESLSLRGEGRLVVSGGSRRCTIAIAGK